MTLDQFILFGCLLIIISTVIYQLWKKVKFVEKEFEQFWEVLTGDIKELKSMNQGFCTSLDEKGYEIYELHRKLTFYKRRLQKLDTSESSDSVVLEALFDSAIRTKEEISRLESKIEHLAKERSVQK